MLTFFTDPYEDELLYGAISRYHFYIGNIDYKDTLIELFGKDSIIPSMYLPTNLEYLAKQLGGKYTADYLIKKHTLLPFYAPFLPKDRLTDLISIMRYDNGQGVYAKIGMIAGSICKKDGIYYCPLCSLMDIKNHGEAYIHRKHQVQGVLVCPQHESILQKYPVDKTTASRVEFIRLDAKLLELQVEKNITKEVDNELVKMAEAAQFLLDNDLGEFDKDSISKKYCYLLNEKGFLTTNERIKQRDLHDAFIGFYGKELLRKVECEIDKDNEYNWLKIITRNSKRAVHPIRHILFVNFLVGNIQQFFKSNNNFYCPFGDGPWPCLNPVADHYRGDVISNIKITSDYKTRLPVVTFICGCGFSYSRKGPDKLIEDKFKIGRIKEFGLIWENKLRSYLKEEKYGLRELARLMGCDPKTIIKFDKKLGINYFSNSQIAISDAKNIENQIRQIDIQAYKDKITNTMWEHPNLSRTQIRELCKKEYTYLYKHDKQWLFLNLPSNQYKQKIDYKSNSNQRINWKTRDEEMLIAVKETYSGLIVNNKPIRITKSRISRALGSYTTLEKRLNKLPKTNEFMEDILESVEDFQLRRSKRIIDEKIMQQEDLRLWEVQKLAGIRSEDFYKIKRDLTTYIEDIRGNIH